MTCTAYCVKIEDLFDAMMRLSYEVLPENRRLVEYYIYKVWELVTMFVQSFKREGRSEELESKFESHVTAEEARLRQKLEGVRYRIDGSDTFRIVAGEGRVETVIKGVYSAGSCGILT